MTIDDWFRFVIVTRTVTKSFRCGQRNEPPYIKYSHTFAIRGPNRNNFDIRLATYITPEKMLRIVQLVDLALRPGEVDARRMHAKERVDHVVFRPHERKQGVGKFQRVGAQRPDPFPSQS